MAKQKKKYPEGWQGAMAMDVAKVANCSTELVRRVATGEAQNEKISECILRLCEERLRVLNEIKKIQ